MKGSPIFDIEPNIYEYDFQTDFARFLEEAKKHAKGKEQVEEVKSQQQGKQVNLGEKVKRKSWKNAVLSLLFKSSAKKKVNNKQCSSMVEVSLGNNKHGLKKGTYFSGPVQVSNRNADGRQRLASSGPLAGLFQGKKKEEVEMKDIPYVSLQMVNKPQHCTQTYGPIYLVS